MQKRARSLSQRKRKRGIGFTRDASAVGSGGGEFLKRMRASHSFRFPSLSSAAVARSSVSCHLCLFCDTPPLLPSEMAPHAAVGVEYEPSSPVAEVRRKKKRGESDANAFALESGESTSCSRFSKDLLLSSSVHAHPILLLLHTLTLPPQVDVYKLAAKLSCLEESNYELQVGKKDCVFLSSSSSSMTTTAECSS